MTRRLLSIVIVTTLGGLVGLFLVSFAGVRFGDSAARSVVGWTLPAFLAAIGGGVSWLLLSDDATTDSATPVATAHCGTCGHSVIEDWRLCPHCGTLVEESGVTGNGSDLDVAMRSVAESKGIR